MALRYQQITVPLVGGINQNMSELNMSPPDLLACHNVDFTKQNSIKMRNGWKTWQENADDNINRLIGTPDKMYACTTYGALYQQITYPSGGRSFVSICQSIPTIDQTLSLPEYLNESTPQIAKLSQSVANDVDIAATALYYGYVYVDDYFDKTYLIVKSRADDTVLYKNVIYDGICTWPRLTASTDYEAMIFTYVKSGGLFCKIITISTGVTIGSETTLSATCISTSTQPRYDITSDGYTGGYALAYQATQTHILFTKISHLGAEIYAPSYLTTSNVDGYGMSVACAGSIANDGYSFITYYDGYAGTAGIYQHTYIYTVDDPGGATTVADLVSAAVMTDPPAIATVCTSAYTCAIYFNYLFDYDSDYPANGVGSSPIIKGNWLRKTYGSSAVGSGLLAGMHPITKPWYYNNNVYIWAADFQKKTNYLLELPHSGTTNTFARVVTTANYTTAYSNASRKLITTSVIGDTAITGAKYFLFALTGEDPADPNADYKVGFTKYEAKNDAVNLFQSEFIDGTLYLAGGNLMQYDGIEIQENNFLQTPNIYLEEVDESATGLEVGSYWYTACYEYVDNNGNHHRSVPATPIGPIDIYYTAQDINNMTYNYLGAGGLASVNPYNSQGPSKGVDHDGYIVVTLGGPRGTAKIKYSDDGGITLSAEQTTVAGTAPNLLSDSNVEAVFSSDLTLGAVYHYHWVVIGGRTRLDELKDVNVRIDFTADNTYNLEFIDSTNTVIRGYIGQTVPSGGGTEDLFDGYTEADGYTPSGMTITWGDFPYLASDSYVIKIEQKTGVRIHFGANNLTYRYDGRSVIVPYRTTAYGEIYYRLPNWDEVETWTMEQSGGQGLVNVPTDITYTSYACMDPVVSNDDLAYHGALYAPPDGSGQIPNDHPWGGIKGMKYHKNRLFMISAENPSRILYTKEYQKGFPLSYSLGQEITVQSKLIGLASSDEALIGFAEDGVYVILGQGPDATGDPRSGTFEVFKLNGPPGCINPRSIVTIPQGTLYQSKQGIHLLTKSYQQIDIGQAIQDIITPSTTIYDSCRIDSVGKVAWITNNASYPYVYLNYTDFNNVTEQVSARFSTALQGWGSFTPKYISYKAEDGYETMYGVTTDTSLGWVYYPAPNNYLDRTSSFNMYIKTGFINFGTDQEKRLKKIKIVGNAYNQSLQMFVYNSNVYTDSTEYQNWTSTEMQSLYTRQIECTHYVWYQKGRGWQLEISTLPVEAGTPTGFEISGLTFELGIRNSLHSGTYR